jgi:hypothetical protein
MAGYNGFSMSNNAVAAYYNGEKPKSKWTKTDIIDIISNAIKEEEINPLLTLQEIKKIPAQQLKDKVLRVSSWHHTSSHYNKTDFYSVDLDAVEGLTANDLIKKQPAAAATPAEQKCKCVYLEWSGSRKHPKATECTAWGTIKGNWFFPDGETFKKSVNANGFKVLERA